MKHVSKFLVAATAMLLTSAVSAGTLYWQVDGNDLAGQVGASSDGYGAQLWMLNTDTNEKESFTDGYIDAPTGVQQADITNYSNDEYLFFVELINYTTGDTKDGYKWSYGELTSSGYVALGAQDIPRVNAAVADHGSNFSQAPEPSSGLLLLMGGAMLALRRRRQK